MTDISPSWQDDPTGRHDHRYWDGTQWTEHVADAGVAGVDPYDAAPVADPTLTADSAADPGPTTSPSGWGVATEPDEPIVPEEPADAAPAATWAGWAAPTEVEPPEAEAPPAATVSGWGSPTVVTPSVAAQAEPTADPTTEITAEPTAAIPLGEDASTPPTGGSRRFLLIGLGLLAVIGLVVAILALDGDDDVSTRSSISAALQEGDALSEDDARCVADHIIDDVGAERLDGVDFQADELPDEVSDDVARAYVAAVGECDVEPGGSVPGLDDAGDGSSSDGATDGLDPGATDSGSPGTDIDLGDPDDLEALLVESFITTQRLDRPKAECLAKALTDAIRSGDASADSPFSDPNAYRTYMEECDISPEELGVAEP